MSKNVHVMVFYSLQGILYLWRGLCLITRSGSPEPKLRNELKFPRLLLCLTADFWGLVGYITIMKKQLLLLVMMLLPIVAIADPVEIDGIYYNLISKSLSAEVTKGNYSGDLVIPEIISYDGKTYQVEGIGEYAFGGEYSTSKINSIAIPKSIKRIEQGAFAACKSLNAVYISSLEAWCNITFAGMNSNPDGYYKLSNPLAYAKHFYINNEEVSHLLIPDGIEEIKDYAFIGFSSLISITIPESVKKIGNFVFEKNSNLTTVIMSNGVEKIGHCAFWGCSTLSEVILSEKLLEIPDGMFYGCSSLKDIAIPETVEKIGYQAFYGCTSFTTVHIPSKVKCVGGGAFQNCTNLQKVTIEDLDAWCNIEFEWGQYLNDISSNPLYFTHHLFLGNKEVTEVVIPDNVESIGFNFAYCSEIKKIVLPSNLQSIGAMAFMECSGLKTIEIPQSVTSIGKSAFNRCCGLTEIRLPQNITTIEQATFLRCSGLKSITIPEGVTNIDMNSFRLCNSLSLIILPESLKGIESGAFQDCPEIKDVYSFSNSVPSSAEAFKDSYINYATLHVPSESVDLYKATDPWKNFKEIVALDGSQTSSKCEKPTISYENGQLKFSSDTEGASFVSEITNTDVNKYNDATVTLTATYNISVYATKAGFNNSDVATATLCWIDQQPATEGITNNVAQVPAKTALIQTDGGLLTVEGLNDGETVAAYTIDGAKRGSAICQNGVAYIDTNLQSGNVAIVKIGQKSVKVLIK